MVTTANPRRKSIWKRALLGLGLILAILIIYHVATSWYYDKQLEKLISEIAADDPDWKWDRQLAVREDQPLEENGAQQVVALLKLTTLHETIPSISRNAWAKAHTQLYQKESFEWFEFFMEMHPNARLPEPMHEKLKPLMEMPPMPQAMQQARKLRQVKSGRYEHVFKPMLMLSLLPDIQGARAISNLLAWDSDLLAWELDWKESLENVQAILGVARTFSHDPFLISQLVRMAIASQACRQTMRLLALNTQWTSSQLKTMQDELQREHDQTANILQHMMKCDRAVLDHDLLALINKKITYYEMAKIYGRYMERETGYVKLDQILCELFPEMVLGWGNRPRHLSQERLDLLRFFRFALTWSRKPDHELMPALDAWKLSGPHFSPFLRNFFSMTMFGAGGDAVPEVMQLRGLTRGYLNNRARLRCCIAIVACERYRLEHGGWPASLQDLTPAFLKPQFLDPYTGQLLMMKTTQDGMVVYSLGDNKTDDGGNVLMTEETQPKDVGYRLWDQPFRGIRLDAECAEYVKKKKEEK